MVAALAAESQSTARLVFGYDGTAFKGWAIQPGMRTVEGELSSALERILGRKVDLTVAGRTDTGVHADAQVASHSGPPATLAALNAVLPPDIVVSRSEQAEHGFCARNDATSRAYAYRIAPGPARPLADRDRTLWWPKPFDPGLLDRCAELLPGQHDMTAFTPTKTLHRYFEPTILSAGWVREGDRMEFRIESNWFLRHMNRVLVGTMLDVASGLMELSEFEELLDGRPRLSAGQTAQPHGLRLLGIGYGKPVIDS